MVDPPQVELSDVNAELDAKLSALVVVTIVDTGVPDAPIYDNSIQMSSSFGTAPPPQMPYTVTVTVAAVVLFQMAIGILVKGQNHLLLAVVSIFQATDVVPSEAPPVLTIVVSTF